MPRFDDDSLYAETLPTHFGPMLDDLGRLLVAARARDGEAIPPLHTALMEAGRRLDPADWAVNREDAEAAFVSGALRAARYEKTVLCDDVEVVDTAGSDTLHAFTSDLTEFSEAQVRAALLAAFQPPAAVLAHVDDRVEEETAQLDLRHRIIGALDRRYPLRQGADNRAVIDQLFGALYPDNPLRPDEVEIIRTGTGLFFCLPHDGERLVTRAEDDPQEAEIRAFLAGLTGFHPSQSAHFPSFGSLHRESVPLRLVVQLAEDAGLSPEVVAETLPTMVVILPLAKIDQYIVHDAWGHGWQAMLFRFEETYQRVAGYNRLPRLDEAFARPGQAPLTMRQALLSPGLERWEAFLEAACAARLYDALGNLSAEVLADVVEYKFLAQNPEQSALMPSSSFVKDFPTKLDLTIWDLPMYFERAIQGFERFAEEPRAVERLHAALGGAVELSVLHEAAVRTDAFLKARYGEQLRGGPVEGDRIAVTPIGRVAVNYLGLHARFNDLYARMREADPDVQFADLLVFSVAAYLEEDWAARFWHCDALLDHFEELYARFMAELGTQSR